jgi:ABC-type branched-subunit amino acid transport system substrate-binding protein
MARRALLVAALVTGCGQAPQPASAPQPGETRAEERIEGRREPEPIQRPRMPAAEEAEIAARVDTTPAAALAAAWPRMDPEAAAAQAVALRLALLALHRGERGVARRWLARAGGGERARALSRAMAVEPRVDPRRIAVLLPLSGKHARLGREMRVAIELAAAEPAVTEDQLETEEDGAGERASRVGGAILVFHDTRGEGAEAERQVERAAREGAFALLGPVGQAEARAAAARAMEHGIAIALLAPDGAGAAPDVGVFRLWPSAEWEAGEAARLAAERGHDRVAVLHPRDPQGAAQAEAFQSAARATGATVVAAGDYDPAARDLEPDVRRFLGLDPATNERLRRHLARHGRKQGWKSFSPDVDFDLLYIPDDHARAALVASYLPYFNIEVRDSEVVDTLSLRKKHGGRIPSLVQLLGSSGWYHAGLAHRGGAAVEGALIVVPCGTGTDAGDQSAELAERFEARTGRPPGPLAAQAHDAALLLLSARAEAAPAGPSRASLGRALRTAHLPDGACGPSNVDPSGQLHRFATLLRVDSGGFTPAQL